MTNKLNKYIECIDFNDEFILFNKINGAIILVHKANIIKLNEVYYIINESNGNIKTLQNNGFFLEDTVIEKYIQTLNAPHTTTDTTIVISLTEICNLDCRYCYQHKWDKQAHISDVDYINLVKDYLISILPKLKTDDTLHICFIGGEPLLKLDLMLSFVKEIGLICRDSVYVRYHIDTNGMFLNEEIFKHFPNLELYVTISLPDDHNKLRSNSFQKVLSGLKRISSLIDHEQYRLTIRYNTNHENVHSIGTFLAYLKKDENLCFELDIQNIMNFEYNTYVNKLSNEEFNKVFLDEIIEKLDENNLSYSILPDTSLTRHCLAENIYTTKFYSNGERVICDAVPKSPRSREFIFRNLPEQCIKCSDFPLCGGEKPCDDDKCDGVYENKADAIARVIAYTKTKITT